MAVSERTLMKRFVEGDIARSGRGAVGRVE